jgi:hypothetical protein
MVPIAFVEKLVQFEHARGVIPEEFRRPIAGGTAHSADVGACLVAMSYSGGAFAVSVLTPTVAEADQVRAALADVDASHMRVRASIEPTDALEPEDALENAQWAALREKYGLVYDEPLPVGVATGLAIAPEDGLSVAIALARGTDRDDARARASGLVGCADSRFVRIINAECAWVLPPRNSTAVRTAAEGINAVLTARFLSVTEKVMQVKRLLRGKSPPMPAPLAIAIAAALPETLPLLEMLAARGVPIPRIAVEAVCTRVNGSGAVSGSDRTALQWLFAHGADLDGGRLLVACADGAVGLELQKMVLDAFPDKARDADALARGLTAAARLRQWGLADELFARAGMCDKTQRRSNSLLFQQLARGMCSAKFDAVLRRKSRGIHIDSTRRALRVGLRHDVPYGVEWWARSCRAGGRPAPEIVFEDIVVAATAESWNALRVVADCPTIGVAPSELVPAAHPEHPLPYAKRAVLFAYATTPLSGPRARRRSGGLWLADDEDGAASFVVECATAAEGAPGMAQWAAVLGAVAKLPRGSGNLAAGFRALLASAVLADCVDLPRRVQLWTIPLYPFGQDVARAREVAEFYPLADAALMVGDPIKFAWVVGHTDSRPSQDGVDFAAAMFPSAALRQALKEGGYAPSARVADIAAERGNVSGMAWALSAAGAGALGTGFELAMDAGDFAMLETLSRCKQHHHVPASVQPRAVRAAAIHAEVALLHNMWWWGWAVNDEARDALRRVRNPPPWIERWLAGDTPGLKERAGAVRKKKARAARKAKSAAFE